LQAVAPKPFLRKPQQIIKLKPIQEIKVAKTNQFKKQTD